MNIHNFDIVGTAQNLSLQQGRTRQSTFSFLVQKNDDVILTNLTESPVSVNVKTEDFKHIVGSRRISPNRNLAFNQAIALERVIRISVVVNSANHGSGQASEGTIVVEDLPPDDDQEDLKAEQVDELTV